MHAPVCSARLPVLTTFLCAVALGFATLPSAAQESLYFDYDALAMGRWTGIVTGHWIHADTGHLAWNVAALAVLSWIIEARSRRLLLWGVLLGTVAVGVWLASPLCDIARYCGLSGLLNTLLGIALYLLWRSTASPVVLVVAALCVVKLALEIALQSSLFTTISWPPYPLAHLAGIAATPIALLLGCDDTGQ